MKSTREIEYVYIPTAERHHFLPSDYFKPLRCQEMNKNRRYRAKENKKLLVLRDHETDPLSPHDCCFSSDPTRVHPSIKIKHLPLLYMLPCISQRTYICNSMEIPDVQTSSTSIWAHSVFKNKSKTANATYNTSNILNNVGATGWMTEVRFPAENKVVPVL
jgi:hypothetical protein